jgi:hypothetical protein
MSDARIDCSLPGHPKMKKLVHRLHEAGAWGFVRLVLWARENRSDGDLAGLSDEDLELAVDWHGEAGKLIATLHDVGFVDGLENERQLHDWAQHQPWAEGEKERKESSKWSAMVRHHGFEGAKLKMPEYYATHRERCGRLANRTPSDTKRNETQENASGKPAPSPSPSPSPIPTWNASAVADEPQLSLVADPVPPATPPTGSDAKKKKGGRPRNLLFDAMLELCEMPLEGLTGSEAGRVAAALRDIRGAMPEGITPEALLAEIRIRARRYRDKWPDIDLTPTGLAANWSQFGAPQKKEGGAAQPLLTIEEPPEGHEQAMEALFGEQWREMCPGWPQMTASDKSQVRAWLREHGKEAA